VLLLNASDRDPVRKGGVCVCVAVAAEQEDSRERMGQACVLWGSEATFTINEREQKTREPKCRRMQKKKTKKSFSTVNFLKVDPLYKRRSASFYRETNKLFTY
jgi:hypothetical protein